MVLESPGLRAAAWMAKAGNGGKPDPGQDHYRAEHSKRALYLWNNLLGFIELTLELH
jgi:hypothetical protein